MEDDDIDPVVDEKARTILSVLDLAMHPNTSDQEALAAINAYRRLAKGSVPSIICERYFGDPTDDLYLDDQWQERYAEQELENSRLRSENRRLKKALDEAKRRHRRMNGEASSTIPIAKEIPELILTDVEWIAIEHIIPVKQRCEKGRERIAKIVVVLRTGCGWRVLAPEGRPTGWTTYYNQHRSWSKEAWWSDMMEALKGISDA